MNKMDRKLYDYLWEHISHITDKSLLARDQMEGAIYSVNSDNQTEAMLREQNTLTNKAIISALLDDEQTLENYINEWAHIVATSRIASDTPTYQVIQALSIVQEVFLSFVHTFIHDHNELISKDDIIRWFSIFNSTFNKLKTRFSKMYYQLIMQRISSQQDLIAELSTPIIPISDTVAILPLNGNVDTNRMKEIYETVPEKVVDSKVEYLFIDLSGIPVLDSYVAKELWNVVYLMKTLGIQTAISGIQPEVAHSVIQFQTNFKSVPTYSTLKQALKMMVTGVEKR
jgi:rsbT co-antagonist protein RsbR